MKRAIIVHCWEGTQNYCWYPAVKKELEGHGFEVQVPEMPETLTPKLTGWLPKLTEVIGSPNEELILIGHSLGCITIMRYLETLNERQKVGGVILIAGYTDDLGFEQLKNFYVDPISFEKIKKRANHFVAINSDNDPYVDIKYGSILQKKLGARLIIKHNMGHFSGAVDNEESCTELPDVVEEVLSMTKL